ncbi:MAG: hypothetical protein OQK67_07850, partial [Chlorobium sp.]|nr:hypothetical protein [Chlorobium sp.]
PAFSVIEHPAFFKTDPLFLKRAPNVSTSLVTSKIFFNLFGIIPERFYTTATALKLFPQSAWSAPPIRFHESALYAEKKRRSYSSRLL